MAPLLLSRVLALPPGIRCLAAKRALGGTTLRSSTSQPTAPFATSSTGRAEATSSPGSPESSVNHTEVSHFNSLASSWWDPHGSSRLLHLMNPLRHKFIRQCLSNDIQDGSRKLRYLDIGCGGGIFAESAARLPNTDSVTAVDPTPEVIAVAQRHQRQDPLLLEHGRLKYHNCAIEDLPESSSPKAGYDIVTLFEVIEHIRNPSPFLHSALKHLKPGGWLIGSTIARTSTSWFTTKFMAEDVLRLVPRGTHDWNQYISPHELQQWGRVQPELDAGGDWWQVMGVVYFPGLGWKEVEGSEAYGNYFFAMRKRDVRD